MTHLSITDLSKTYPSAPQPALNNLTLDIPSGSLTALLGPSGCGKTTALKIIAGLLAPTSGDVRLDGTSILSQSPDRRGAVMVFQNPLLFPHMTVAENIGFGLSMRHLPKADIAARVAEMLTLIQLPNIGPRRPSQLSGGQAQRVALARALILRPRLLLLDEPLSNLDTTLRAEMRDLIRSLQRKTGITTIFVTHDQEEAVVLADQIALILDGRLQQFGTPDAFFKRPATQTIARFFGGVNFIAGHNKGGTFSSALGALLVQADLREGPGTLTIRPENIRLGAAKHNTVQATLLERTYLGVQTRLILCVGGVNLESAVNPDDAAQLDIGAILPINLPPESLWLLPQISTGANQSKAFVQHQ